LFVAVSLSIGLIFSRSACINGHGNHGRVAPAVNSLVTEDRTDIPPSTAPEPGKPTFAQDFRRFFVSGLAALLPTLITLSLILWVWNFLWDSLGVHLVHSVRLVWYTLSVNHVIEPTPAGRIGIILSDDRFSTRCLGVGLAVLLVYIVGVFVGNLIGRTAWRVAERAVMRIPLVRAIYPAVKQVTDFVLTEKSAQFKGSRVVAVRPHENNIWSIALVTGQASWALKDGVRQEMLTVFVPSSPTAFSGYVMIVPKSEAVELPLSVEEAMRLLVSGGVIAPPEPAQQSRRPGAESAAPSVAASTSPTGLLQSNPSG
jgi:uncharacterized membrane protein